MHDLHAGFFLYTCILYFNFLNFILYLFPIIPSTVKWLLPYCCSWSPPLPSPLPGRQGRYLVKCKTEMFQSLPAAGRVQSRIMTLFHILRHSARGWNWFRCRYLCAVHCKENPVYVFLFWELRCLSFSFHIHVSVSDLYIPRIGPHISLQLNSQTDPGNI